MQEDVMMQMFCIAGRADTVLGGQFGSEGKGAAVAWLANFLALGKKQYSIVTCNAGSQAGHTAIHNGVTYVTRHLPTAPLISPGSRAYLNAGCVIDPDVLEEEIKKFDYLNQCDGFFIHPNAAVITPDCLEVENKDETKAKIASTRKGVGEAVSRKVLRSGMIAAEHPFLRQFVKPINLNNIMTEGKSVLVEIPQGYGLSLNYRFYPYCTSRDCTVMQALSDAHIHPHFLGNTMLVLRSYPIRVGGTSGDGYPDQVETNWTEIGQEPEITTVTKRVRRVFTWSTLQVHEAVLASRPSAIFLTHCDYFRNKVEMESAIFSILAAVFSANLPPPIIWCANGPTTTDAKLWVRA